MIEANTSDLDALQKFIKNYEIRRLSVDEPPTLMEIAGFPHWENVYSNILAFLIRTDEVHGFGPLLIRSILAAYRDRLPPDRQDQAPDPDKIDRLLSVEREITTKHGNRIDILIEGTGLVVCIENKIWSPLKNDLAEYRQYCEDRRGECFLGIVLSPDRISAQAISKLEDPKRRRGGDLKFVSVTYSDLVARIRKRMGHYIGVHNTRYHYLLFDFLEQVERLERHLMLTEEAKKFLLFWKKNKEKIENIRDNCGDLLDLLHRKEFADQHLQQCLDKMEDEDKAVFSPFVWKKETAAFDLADNEYLDDGCRIFLDVWFQPLRIEHQLGKRAGPGLGTRVDRIKEEATSYFREWVTSGEGGGVSSGMQAIDITFNFNPSSGRYVALTDLSPFCQAHRKQAVAISVAILKAVANMGRERDASGERRG